MDLNPLVAALGTLVLERLHGGTFIRRGAIPQWCDGLTSEVLWTDQAFVAEDVFPFLASFLDRAETVWHGKTIRVASDFWTELGQGGEEIHLEASAVRVGDTPLLAITENNRLFVQQQLVLQRARELRITHDALMQEFELKDILVHTIVHDLAAPLHSILGALSLLDEMALSQSSKRWIQIGIQAAMRQRELIREILDVSLAEHAALEPPDSFQDLPDLQRVIAEVLAEMAPVARQREVRLEVEGDLPTCRVLGEATRLFRVLSNLVDNGLRFSPTGGSVSVHAWREDGAVVVTISDQGPGVPLALLPRLFEKFAHGGERGSTGLGLYFCRITVEQWGGSIGYEPRRGGGAKFWVRLPLAEQPRDDHGEPVDSRR